MDIRSGFYLDKWFVCPKELVLFDGQNYQRLEPKVMEVLVYLHDNLNEVVSREQLIEHVWQGRYASDESITRVISVLRRAFNESHQDQRLIKTIPKQGYQLCWQQIPGEQAVEFASIHQQVKSAGKADSDDEKFVMSVNKRSLEKYVWPLLALLLAISLFTLADFAFNHNGKAQASSKQVRILVRPFTSLDESHIANKAAALIANDLKYTLGGIKQSELNILSMVEGQKAIPSDYILTGSVMAQQDMLQIEVEFIDVKSSANVWQHRFYFQLDDYLQLLNIVRDTVGYYFSLLPTEQYRTTRIEQMLPQILIERAKELRRSFDLENVEAALELLENARLLYPDHQQILPELAYTQLELYGLEQLSGLKPAPIALVTEGLDIDSGSTDIPLMQLNTLIHKYNQQKINVEQLIKEALLLEPDFTDNVEYYTLLGNWYKESGDYQTAQSYFKQAISIRQDYAKSHYCLAELQSLIGDNELAINTVSLYLRNFPQQTMLQSLSLKLYLSVGLFDQVIYGLKQYRLPLDAGFDGDQPSYFIQAYGFLNRPERVLEVTDELSTTSQAISVNQLSCWLPPSINTPLATPEFCLKRAKRAESVSNDLDNLMAIARRSLLLEQYEQAIEYYEKVRGLMTQKKYAIPLSLSADLIYAYAQSGNAKRAQQMGTEFLNLLRESPRLGLSGIGINDVVVLTALERNEEAVLALENAINEGWLHWYNWQYRGPHPALNLLAKTQPLNELQTGLNARLEHLYNRSN